MSDLSFINCPDAVTILKNKKNNIAFIDVRKRKTYVQQFAFGAINCPMNRFHFIIQDSRNFILLFEIHETILSKIHKIIL